MTPTEYEQAVVERFRTYWPPPKYVVRHDIRLQGRKTRARRQIDISVFEAGETLPFLVAEAKRHRRPIDAVRAGSTVALMQDIGGVPAVMVSTSGFSLAAQNHLVAEGIEFLRITITEARGLRWIPMIEQNFLLDREFREQSGDLIEAVRVGNAEPFFTCHLPFEEWLAVLRSARSIFPDHVARILRSLAKNHFDDGVRYNAIEMLEDAGELDAEDISEFLQNESDPDTRELLSSFE